MRTILRYFETKSKVTEEIQSIIDNGVPTEDLSKKMVFKAVWEDFKDNFKDRKCSINEEKTSDSFMKNFLTKVKNFVFVDTQYYYKSFYITDKKGFFNFGKKKRKLKNRGKV